MFSFIFWARIAGVPLQLIPFPELFFLNPPLTTTPPPPRLQLVGCCLVAVALLEGSSARTACSHLLRERGEAVLSALRTDAVEDSVQRQVARAARLLLHTLQLVMALFCGALCLQFSCSAQASRGIPLSWLG